MNIARIESADGSTAASFAPEAGMVCCSLQHHGEELLDTGQGLEAYAERGKTMGIPLLYPWANRLERFELEVAGHSLRLPTGGDGIPLDPNGLAIHGVMPGLMRWQAAADGTRLTASLDWESERLLELFPFRHRVGFQAEAQDGALSVTVTVLAAGEDSVPVSFGFHPYLRLPGSRQGWQVALPEADRLLLDERSIPTGAREPLPDRDREFLLGDSSWDDGLALAGGPARFEARSGERTIAVELEDGYAYGQVYAPPGHDYICFEPMTAPTNALISGEGLIVLEPGQEHRAAFRVLAS